MIIIALMLELVAKTNADMDWMNMLLMLTIVTSNPMEKGMKQQVQDKSW